VSRTTLQAAAASFVVYAIPLVTAHWVLPFGAALAAEMTSDRALGWKAVDIALALTVQLAIFALVRLVSSRSTRLAIGAVVVALLPATVAVNTAYLLAIPSWFLIDADPVPDLDTWQEACSIRGFALSPVRGGLSRAIERRGEAVVVADGGARFAILGVPGCVIDPIAAPRETATSGLHQVLSDGSVVFTDVDRSTGSQQFWLMRRGTRTSVPLTAPSGADLPPLVADEGTHVAWRIRGDRRTVAIHAIGSGPSFRVAHELLDGTTSTLLELNMAGRELAFARGLDMFAAVSLDGAVLWGPVTSGDVAAQPDTARRFDEQWLWWDASREDGPYRVQWSTRGGRQEHVVPRGRHVTAAALDPDGRYVAASTTTSLNIGNIPDAVFVLRTSDAVPVWRKTLMQYARSEVAFLGRRHFAYSEFEETGNSAQPLTGRVRVLAVP
jgi:hypothetical protein